MVCVFDFLPFRKKKKLVWFKELSNISRFSRRFGEQVIGLSRGSSGGIWDILGNVLGWNVISTVCFPTPCFTNFVLLPLNLQAHLSSLRLPLETVSEKKNLLTFRILPAGTAGEN